MKLEDLKEFLDSAGFSASVLFSEPDYIDAVIGYDQETGRVIYSYNLMVEWLMKEDNISQEEAMEFIDYNTIRALPYAGQNGPIVMWDLKEMLD